MGGGGGTKDHHPVQERGTILLLMKEIGVRIARLVGARAFVREVPSSIPSDLTTLFRLLSILCSFR